MKYFVAIAVFFVVAATLGSNWLDKATQKRIETSPTVDCRGTIPKGSSVYQAAMYVIATCGDPPPNCHSFNPPDKLQGKSQEEVELRTLIACGTRAELQAFLHRTQDRAQYALDRERDRNERERDRFDRARALSVLEQQQAQAQVEREQQQAQEQHNREEDRIWGAVQVDEIIQGLRNLGR